ncbi:class II aldolase/adducin family protein [Streptomyces malaysiensis subsp. malaysiensis]|uniref:class II aldolase/adducin family protein n=1 Tax=Streptomyces malaysiensis TaxID=92644 RepID=UPI000BFE28C7|nr:class II aldolase/adducin family protein [Streptomyces malaysiensis]ATL88112.1 L-fuculose phosphate aldolase [Streptomyces malaysiensis]QDL68562.1 class II aldolase/adducin family protein [Streptomyces malaysiensis]
MNVVADVVSASRALATAGLSDMVWGHASVRDPEGQGAWMKASGFGFEEINEDRVVLVSPEGGVLRGSGKRHLEFPIHTEILARRADVGAVVHTHAPALSAFSSLQRELRPISHDAVPFAHPQLPRFTVTGALIATRDLGRALAEGLGDANAILMPHHGAVTVGPDIGTAVMYAVLLERACRTQLLADAAGGALTASSEAETRFKREQIWNPDQLKAGWEYLVRRAHG